ncbi:MAG: PKD domain-containing protein, partial [Methanobacteriota archaeon]
MALAGTLLLVLLVPWPSTAETGAVPTYFAGYRWELYEPVTKQVWRFTVSSVGETVIEGATHDTVTIFEERPGDSGETELFFNVHDEATMLLLARARTLASASERGELQATYHPPVDLFGHPLSVGKSWRVDSARHVVGRSGAETIDEWRNDTKSNYTVLSEETLDTAAGAFRAFKVHEVPTDPLNTFIEREWIRYYSPEARNFVGIDHVSSGNVTLSYRARQVVVNIAPFAAYVATPPSPWKRSEAVFDATGSRDQDDPLVRYAWDFDDGTVGEGEVVRHEFARSGIHNVSLTVTDARGLTTTATDRVQVRNRPPT